MICPPQILKALTACQLKLFVPLQKFVASGVRYNLIDTGGKPKMFRVHEMAIMP